LLAHSWPGNVRELMNTIRRASLRSTGAEISPADLGLVMAPGTLEMVPEREPDRAEIEGALARARGVIARAARELGPEPPGSLPPHGEAGAQGIRSQTEA
jgi:transcriptional regulator of acetoin/glycerol metabolism